MTSVWHYEQGLIPMFAAITAGVGILMGIGTAMAASGAIALVVSLYFLIKFDNIRGLQ